MPHLLEFAVLLLNAFGVTLLIAIGVEFNETRKLSWPIEILDREFDVDFSDPAESLEWCGLKIVGRVLFGACANDDGVLGPHSLLIGPQQHVVEVQERRFGKVVDSALPEIGLGEGNVLVLVRSSLDENESSEERCLPHKREDIVEQFSWQVVW